MDPEQGLQEEGQDLPMGLFLCLLEFLLGREMVIGGSLQQGLLKRVQGGNPGGWEQPLAGIGMEKKAVSQGLGIAQCVLLCVFGRGEAAVRTYRG